MLNLSKITLTTIVTRSHELGQASIMDATRKATFKNVIVFTDRQDLFGLYNTINIGQKNYREWCIWRLTEMPKHRKNFSEYILFIESDSAIVKPDAWTNEFYRYDYIGAPWLDGVQGNGGFCLMSQRLLAGLETLHLPPTETACFPSDYKICRIYRRFLENNGVKFAPLELAQQFSSELGPYTNSFGIHNYRGCQKSTMEANK